MSGKRLLGPAYLALFVVAVIAAFVVRAYLLTPPDDAPIPASEPEAKPMTPEEVLTSGTKAYSQFDEELVIRHFFEDRTGGVFLDVGCSWPIKFSTTFYLERHLNWTGIGIDAQDFYRPLWEKTRPNSKFLAFAVSDKSGEKLKFFVAPEARGVSSLSRDHVESWEHESVEIEVETITLNKLLDDKSVSRIDFLSMDIEGAEIGALKGFDIERFRPSLVCIEIWPDNTQIVKDYFAKHGYELIERYREYDKINWYFRP
ncbi:MAG: FkbM family methyltransferase, partial [bacterium]|nr:FkbM family methyltransferase [bacterium]